ncbi:cell surface glycoprotein 1-like isoform X2 [Penaeus japonicus]|uniref:cell surface glycoprotein 1-like isoform X2 n=1 Tax=Penaeus japonicus TaxID=27405 RepID=UPI001C70BA20|nr:cell surface glycoprotein 1-like isoform X2 [Penaeus japonicus]
MVEPAGAMAMFVLRLAGLLSLENALQNKEANLTDAAFNMSALPFSEENANFTWPLPLNESGEFGEPAAAVGASTTPLLPPKEPYVTTPSTTTTTGAPPTTTTTSTTTTTTTTATPETFTTTTEPSKREVLSAPTLLTDSTSERRSWDEGHVKSTTLIANGEASHPLTNDDAKTAEQEDVMQSEEQDVPLDEMPRASPLSDVRPEEESIATQQYETGDREEEEGEIRETEDDSDEVPDDVGAETADPDDVRDDLPVLTPPPLTSTSTPTPTPRPPGKDAPHLEALAEDDALLGIISPNELAGLEAPPEDFIPSDFEYYDFGEQRPDETAKPTLSSMNLVSPIPVGRGGSLRPNPSLEWDDDLDDLGAEESDIPVRSNKVSPPRPVPPIYPRNQEGRNNPYPYGPRLLPGPYAPLTPNVPRLIEDHGEDIYHRSMEEYDYEEFEYYYDSDEESKYEVQTKEPPVLFVFDKPGYSPEAPTTVLPPSRAPTPSDPWDCAPRCPKYTLLDWNTDYDVRHYPETSWVSTVIISDNRVLAELEGYMRVQDYFYGLNDHGLVLNLTIPFVTQIKFGKHPGVLEETNDYTVSLYVQPAYFLHDQRPPTPISNEVLVDELEPKTVFVHNFEANVWDVTEAFLEEKVNALMAQLRHNGEAFLDRYYYLASYSRPELYQPVYYEIWVYATNFRDPQTTMKTIGRRRTTQVNKITQKTLSKLCRANRVFLQGSSVPTSRC